MDRATRKELKHDKFVLEVQHGVEYVSEHRRMLIRYGTAAVAVVVLATAFYFFREHQREARQQDLVAALDLANAQVGAPQTEFATTFPTEAEKNKALDKAFSELAAKHAGTETGTVAEYYLGAFAADRGDIAAAERHFKSVADSGEAYATLAKLALGRIYAGEGKTAEARNVVKSVVDHPNALASKEEATIALAEIIGPSSPQEARRLLEPLRGNQRAPVSRAALTALADLPAAK